MYPQKMTSCILRLITPDSKKPQRQTLYTLKDLQQAAVKVGMALAVSGHSTH